MAGKLGRRPAVHTRRTMRLGLAMARSLDPLGAPPAKSDDYTSAVEKQSPKGWMCWWNNTLGDCVCEDSGHQVMLHTANAGSIVIPEASDILALYEAVGGYVLSNPATDQGCDETAMGRYMQTVGLCGQKAAATGPVDPANVDHLKWAVQLFGACRLGVNIPQSAMTQFDAGQPWEPVADDGGILGGHDVPIVEYDSDFLYVVTWGKLQPVAWAWLVKYVDEAHAEVYPDWIRSGGTAPSGFDLQALLADAQAIEQEQMAAPKSRTASWFVNLGVTVQPGAPPTVSAGVTVSL
jgi:hypothetical protein